MQSAEEGNLVMVKLSDGEDLVTSLEHVAEAHGIQSGAVLWGIGMLQDFEIGFYGSDGYVKRSFRERHELLGLHGSIAMRAEPKFHLHVVMAGRDHAALGGHLFRGKVCMVNEICLVRFKSIKLDRKPNPATRLSELQVSD